MASATRVARLTATRSSIEAIIQNQTAAWEAAGCPPTFSIDGESYSWDQWLQSKLEAIDKLNAQIVRARPYFLRSRHRG